ncbi:hypothetical protein JB92DRAFT_2892629 [Gautieria morchelliformis]|nr:hypothetical protein JB92DRAFT_2892629 [Gautieria morchelliformis]
MRMLLGGGGAARVRSSAVHWRMVERRRAWKRWVGGEVRTLERGRSRPVRMRMLLGGGGVGGVHSCAVHCWMAEARRYRRTGCSASTHDDGRARACGICVWACRRTRSVRIHMLLGGGGIGHVSGCAVHCRVLGARRWSGDVGEEVQMDGVLCLTAWPCRRTGSVRTRMLLGGGGVGRVCGCIVHCWVLGGRWSSGDTGDEGLTGGVRGCAVRCWVVERRAARCGGLTG